MGMGPPHRSAARAGRPGARRRLAAFSRSSKLPATAPRGEARPRAGAWSPRRMPLQLHAPCRPRGDQPEALAALTGGLQRGARFQTLLGVTGSGKTFTIANVIARDDRPTLVISPNKTLAAQLYGELR